MEILVLYDNTDSRCQEIGHQLEHHFRKYDVKTCHRVSDLITRLMAIGTWNKVLVCIVSQRTMLNELKTFRDSYPELKLVLVLPNQEEQTIKMAHKLEPLFIGYLNEDQHALTTVVERILDRKNKRIERFHQ